MVSVANLIPDEIGILIAKKTITQLISTYENTASIKIQVDENIYDFFITAFPPLKRGARPLVRAIERYIPKAIEQTLGAVSYQADDTLTLDLDHQNEGEFTIKSQINQSKFVFSTLPSNPNFKKLRISCELVL